MTDILVVEDEPDLVLLLVDQLTELGYSIRVATDGAQGVRQALERPPDLVLTDIIMPFMDGAEMLERLQAQPETRNIPVIAMSALSDERARARMTMLGVTRFLAKPYALQDLVGLIDSAIGSATAQP